MKLVIDIPENTYNRIINEPYSQYNESRFWEKLVKNGTLLPKGHGRLIDADELEEWAVEVPSKYLYANKMVSLEDIKAAQVIIEADG